MHIILSKYRTIRNILLNAAQTDKKFLAFFSHKYRTLHTIVLNKVQISSILAIFRTEIPIKQLKIPLFYAIQNMMKTHNPVSKCVIEGLKWVFMFFLKLFYFENPLRFSK